MHINFRETYQSLSTAELLNIVKQANDYQPEAVLAATEILKERTIAETDHSEAERIMSDTKNNWIDERHYVNALSDKIENLAEPISHPETQLTPQKWISILMTGFAVYTIWILVKLMIRWHRLFELNRTGWFSLSDIIVPLFLIVTIAGLYKRKKWGWSLLMIYFLLETMGFAFGIYLSLRYSFYRTQLAGSVLWTLIYSMGSFVLSRDHTKTYFNINNRFLRNTVFVAIIIFLLILVYYI